MARKVLVAEDDPTTRQMLSILLQRKNVDFGLAEDGFRAVKAWETGDFDVIFLDVQMPEMDGIQAAREIRKKETEAGSRHVPIIAMTAHLMPEDLQQCRNVGMDDLISKPIDFKKMLSLIDKYTDGGGAGN